LGDLARPAYLQERDRLRAQQTALTPPQQPDLARAAALLQNLGSLWGAATPAERR